MQDLLFLSHRIPYPPNKGDKIRSWNVLRHLARDYRVHLGCLIDDPVDLQYRDRLRDVCAEVYFGRLNPSVARIASLRGLATGDPLTLAYYRDRRLAAWTRSVVSRHRIRRAFVFSSSMAQYAFKPRPQRLIVDFVDVDSEKWGQYAATRPWPLKVLYRREQRTLAEFERKVAAAADAALFVSDAEADLFRRIAPDAAAKAVAVENGVDTGFFDPAASRHNPYPGAGEVLVFTGAMDYWPNVHAVCWFAREVLPLVRVARPGAALWIVGANPSPDVRRLSELPGVVVTGRVDDIRPYIAGATAVVAPLRLAQGIQNKILEAMAMGKAVIASPKALEGIAAEAGREVVVAEDAVAPFAAATIETLSGQNREALGERARALVLRRYRWSASLARLNELLEDPGLETGAPAETVGGSQ